MIGVISALGFLFFLTVYIGDVTGASVLGFVILVLGWVVWKDWEEGEGPEKGK
jgi:hypothetical protein